MTTRKSTPVNSHGSHPMSADQRALSRCQACKPGRCAKASSEKKPQLLHLNQTVLPHLRERTEMIRKAQSYLLLRRSDGGQYIKPNHPPWNVTPLQKLPILRKIVG
ncbi:hypothetical protein KFK09_026939 [Dendrobium nobile]|uniref:Uncharacterized protein n=1 Tax=Dendrobium nobile TaxID=94219 RepID=A0A8T3A998_DENNO|nr:hypothetical protein KFK09_026939 [Dendrobium nobile]